MRHLPNAISTFRILLTPAVLFLLFTPGLAARIGALALFVIASISDYLDGKIARKLGFASKLGQFLDPVADKVLVLGTFAGLAILMPDSVTWWGFGLIAGRDLAVTLLRSRLARQGKSLKTSWAAKTKTTAQLTFLILVLLLRALAPIPPFSGPVEWIFGSGSILVLFWIVVAITVWTGIAYFRAPVYD